MPRSLFGFPDMSVGLIKKKNYFSGQTVLSLCYLAIFIGLQKLCFLHVSLFASVRCIYCVKWPVVPQVVGGYLTELCVGQS